MWIPDMKEVYPNEHPLLNPIYTNEFFVRVGGAFLDQAGKTEDQVY